MSAPHRENAVMLTQGRGKARFTGLSRYSGIPGTQRKRLHGISGACVARERRRRLGVKAVLRRFGANATHVLAIRGALALDVSRGDRIADVTCLAVALPAIARTLIEVKLGKQSNCAASGASLFCRSVATTESIADVFRVSVPSQVGKPVVGRVAVRVVARIVPIGTRTNKRTQHKIVNFARHYLAVDVERHLKIPAGIAIGLHDSWRADSACAPIIPALALDAQYSAIVTREIAVAAGNRLESLRHTAILPKPTHLGQPEVV
jgi:hypothetical protein